MNATIPDFTADEIAMVAVVLRRRYGRDVALEPAEAELRLDPGDDALTPCPTLWWAERGANFVLCKTGERRYRCQFYYSDSDQYGTGRDEYDDLATCVRTLLQVQADHEKTSSGVSTGATAADLADDDYHGPAIL